MTQIELLARLRSILNEVGVTSGFYSDANNLYKYIDSGQNKTIDRLISLQMKMQRTLPFFEYESLKALLSSKTFSLVSGTDTYTFSGMSLSDYKMYYDLEVDLTNGGVKYGATYREIAKSKWADRNPYNKSNAKYPGYYVDADTQIVVTPSPTANVTSGAILRYYKSPTAVDGSHDFTLKTQTHEAILYFAAALAFEQDKQKSEADKYMKMFDQAISELP